MDLQEALSVMKVEGYKYTKRREDILDVFSNDKRYMTARDVLNAIKDTYPGLSFDTIYRNLSLFYELGILEMTELDGEKHFRMTCETNEHHHHFICLSCGQTKEIEACPMTAISKLSEDVKITGHKFEVYGYCRKCH